MDFFLQLLLSGLVVGSIYALAALGFVLMYKTTGVLNFAQGEFMLVGAYLCLALADQGAMPFWAAMALTLLLVMVMGLIIERLALRPMIGKPVIGVIMLTIGLASLLKCLVLLIWGPNSRVYPQVFSQTPLVLGGLAIPPIYLWTLAAFFLLLLSFWLFYRHSRLGLKLRAVIDDPQAARAMGIRVKNMYTLAWCSAFMVAAVGGIFLGNINLVHVSLGFLGLKVFPAAVLGGLESLPGAVVGGLLIGVIEALSGGYLDPLLGGGTREVAPFVVLVLVLILRPNGLFGRPAPQRI